MANHELRIRESEWICHPHIRGALCCVGIPICWYGEMFILQFNVNSLSLAQVQASLSYTTSRSVESGEVTLRTFTLINCG